MPASQDQHLGAGGSSSGCDGVACRMNALLRLWMLAAAVRILNAATVSTYFVPDEYWQAQEPAYSLVSGAGYRTWEWTPASACAHDAAPSHSSWTSWTPWMWAVRSGPLRSIVPILLYVPSYLALRGAGLTSPWLAGLAPRIAQALLAATGDVGVAAVAAAVDPGAGLLAFVFSLLSPWLWFTSTRTLANSTEAVLVVAALFYWPLSLERPRRRERPIWSLFLASLTLLVRPSVAVFWAYLGTRTLLSARTFRVALAFFATSTAIVSAVLAGSVAVDSSYHGEPALPFLAFGVRNVLQGVAAFYGTAPWHFYLSQALPLLGGLPLYFAMRGAYNLTVSRVRSMPDTQPSGDLELARVVTETSALYLLLHSVLGHKEHRFIQPLAYFVPVLASYHLAQAARGGSSRKIAPQQFKLVQAWRSLSSPLRTGLAFTFLAGVYLTSVHQRGQVLVVHDIAKLSRSNQIQSVGWLMPCHSTPWSSLLQTASLADVRLGEEPARRTWFLTCSPLESCTMEGYNTVSGSRPYVDQADEFYESPATWLHNEMAPDVDPAFPPALMRLFRSHTGQDSEGKIPWPSHLVLFETLLESPGVKEVLIQRGYQPVYSRWNALFTDDERRSGRLQIWAWKPTLVGAQSH